MRRLICCGAAALVACKAAPVPQVFVPDAGYTQSLTIKVQADSGHALRVGEPIRLIATRRSGPWKQVAQDSMTIRDCWWRQEPPAVEPDVGGDVAWQVVPSDSVAFDRPAAPKFESFVRFGRPGKYRLWAASGGCGRPMASDTVSFEIAP